MTLPTASPLVVCLGAHILDILGRPVTAIPPGQGSVLLEEIRLTAAGTAAGTAVDLAKLGARVISMGAIGDDDIAALLVSLLDRHGVDTSHLTRVPGTQTSATMLPIRPNGERPALHVPGATAHLRPGDVDTGLVAAADVLHVGGPDVLGRFSGEPLAAVLAAARAGGALVTMDLLRPGAPEVLDRLAPLLPLVDYFLPNSGQLLAITAAADTGAGIQTVLDAGAGAVAVTMGPDGSRIVADGMDAHIPALPVPVVDTTGCGDAYSAGFIIGICRGYGPEAAGWLGTAAAALVAQGLGSDATLTGLGQVLELIPAGVTSALLFPPPRSAVPAPALCRSRPRALLFPPPRSAPAPARRPPPLGARPLAAPAPTRSNTRGPR